MNVALCSVPTEVPGTEPRRKRSEQATGMQGILPKIAITSLNHWTVKNGYKPCKFYDIDMLLPSDEVIINYFKKNPSDVVGLSAVVSTSYLQVKRLSKLIKQVNNKTIVVCGGYLTSAANTVLKKTDVDICVVGNGEIPWVGILKLIKEYKESKKNTLNIDDLLKINGIAVLDDNKLRFSGYGNSLPGCEMTFPDLEYLKSGLKENKDAFSNYFRRFTNNEMFSMDSRSYEKGRKPNVVSLFTSKGCVAKCTFCQRGSKGYYVYDLNKLENYLQDLVNNHDVGYIYVDDENFGSNKKYTYQVAELFNKYNLLWTAAGVRCTNVNVQDVKHYKKNGCVALKFGIESGSQTILDIMEKKFTVEDIKKAVFACYDNDLYSPAVGYLVGMPGETIKTCLETGKLMGEISAHIGIPPALIMGQIDSYYAIPLVGTPLYEYGKQLGLIGQNVDAEEKYLEMVSNVAAYKRYYINFNGAPMSEVVSWDMVVFMEATRTFYKLTKNKSLNKYWLNKFEVAMKIRGKNPHTKSMQKKVQVMGDAGERVNISFSQYLITNFLKQHVIFSKVLAKIPRFILYPIVRYLLYFEFLFQKYLLKDSHNLHRITNAKVNSKLRIKDNEINPLTTTQKDRSLRTIVLKRMKKLNINETPEEKALRSLTAGP